MNTSGEAADQVVRMTLNGVEVAAKLSGAAAKQVAVMLYAMLDNRYALLFIRGERPVQDFKYDILHHPNVALTTDGKAEPYRHGEDTRSIASITFDPVLLAQAADMELGGDTSSFVLLSEEEMDEYFKQQNVGGNAK